MIEIGNGWVTFAAPAGADFLIGDFTDWDERPIPLNDPVTIEFPEGAYVEYAFLDDGGHMVADPANECRPRNAWYPEHRVAILPHCPFSEPPRAHPLHGVVRQYESASSALGSRRTYYVYEPPVRPIATLFVQDGEAFYRKLRFHEVADVLIERGAIRPVRIVMIEPEERKNDYWFNERYEQFMLDELIPTVEREYGPTLERGLWGASLGGLVASWLALRNADTFALVGSQSGCFTAAPDGHDYYHDPEWLTRQYGEAPHRPVRFYVETGQIEWLLAPNRRFAAMLTDKGYRHSYRERPGGHNWATWEQGLVPGLLYLFGMHAPSGADMRCLSVHEQRDR